MLETDRIPFYSCFTILVVWNCEAVSTIMNFSANRCQYDQYKFHQHIIDQEHVIRSWDYYVSWVINIDVCFTSMMCWRFLDSNMAVSCFTCNIIPTILIWQSSTINKMLQWTNFQLTPHPVDVWDTPQNCATTSVFVLFKRCAWRNVVLIIQVTFTFFCSSQLLWTEIINPSSRQVGH